MASEPYPVNFIDFEDFCSHGSIPSNSEILFQMKSERDIDRSTSLLVYISHAWLRSHPIDEGWDGNPHPDDTQGRKFNLCVDGISKIKNTLAPKLEKCYLWIDYTCTPAGDKGKFRERLTNIVSMCDCMFTPIVGEWSCDAKPRGPQFNIYKDYDAAGWNHPEFGYSNLGWLRLDMLYAATLPIQPLEDDKPLEGKHSKFKAGLKFHAEKGRHAHFIFGSSEMKNDRNPIVAPPLLNQYFNDFPPDKGVVAFCSKTQELEKRMRTLSPSSTSEQYKDHIGFDHGTESKVFSNGDVYSGEWQGGLFHGKGSFTSADGDDYQNCEWVAGERHGFGTCVYANSDRYKGYWTSNKRQGQGECKFANGSIYDGAWKKDTMQEMSKLQLSENALPINLIDFNLFREKLCIPPYNDVKESLVNANAIDKNNTLVIYISHRWIDGANPAPDDAGKNKFKLCVSGITKIMDSLPPKFECFLWIDLTCTAEGYATKYLKEIMTIADCMFTPILDECSAIPKMTDIYEEYDSPSWKSYVASAWCRVDMLYAAHIPVIRVKDKQSRFKAGLRFHALRGRRPHFLFGKSENTSNRQPTIVPPLLNSYLVQYNPREGLLSNPEKDKQKIFDLAALYADVPPSKEVYRGEMDSFGRPHGKGSKQHSNGDVYDGNWFNGTRSGDGLMLYSNDDVYRGRFEKDNFHGRGVLWSADGCEYNGQWDQGVKSGTGSQLYPNGDRYEGDWKENQRTGFGRFVSCQGNEVYCGLWEKDQWHGRGVSMESLKKDGKLQEGLWDHSEEKYSAAFDLQFIEFEDFKSGGQFPRYFKSGGLHGLDEIDRKDSLIVYISHRWIRGYDGRSHPDDEEGHKFNLCVNGISKIKEFLAKEVSKCYIWMDYCCRNEFGREHHQSAILFADCMFTPIYGSWSDKKNVSNYYEDYDADEWKKYLKRSWCRLDMACSAALPVDSIQEKIDKFRSGLRLLASRGERPHFLYGTTEMQNKKLPIALPPLKNSYFTQFDPRHGEGVSVVDVLRIERVLDAYGTRLSTAVAGYEGARNDCKEPHGHGRLVHPNGDIHTGDFENGKCCGRGKVSYSNGSVYIGDMKDDLRDGEGSFYCAIGSEYTGEWKKDSRSGKGKCRYANGDIYDGDWVNGERSGEGNCKFNNGNVYQGHWLRDKMDGVGYMTYANASQNSSSSPTTSTQSAASVAVHQSPMHRSPKNPYWVAGYCITDINRVDEDGNSPLMLAVKSNQITDIVMLLAIDGINMDLQDKCNGDTALMLAVKDNNKKVVAILLNGPESDLSKENNNHLNVVALAGSLGFLEIGALLLSKAKSRSLYYNPETQTQGLGLFKVLKSVEMVEMHRVNMAVGVLNPGARKYYGRSEGDVEVSNKKSEREGQIEKRYPPTFFERSRNLLFGACGASTIIEYRLNVNDVCQEYFLAIVLQISFDLSKPELFDNEVIEAAVDYAWDAYGYRYHLALTFLYFTQLAFVSVDNYTYDLWRDNRNVAFEVIIMFINSLFVILEICQMYLAMSSGGHKLYFGDLFNWIDWTSYSLVYLGIGMRLAHPEGSDTISSIMAVSTIMLLLNLLHFLLPFNTIFYSYVKLIFSVWDMARIIVILLIVIFGFAQAFYLLSFFDKTLLFADPFHGILTAFQALLTTFDFEDINKTSVPVLGTILLSVYIALTAIVILNLLIAVMNNNYIQIQSKQRAEWNRERCKVLLTQRFNLNLFSIADKLNHTYTSCIAREDDRFFRKDSLSAQPQVLSADALAEESRIQHAQLLEVISGPAGKNGYTAVSNADGIADVTTMLTHLQSELASAKEESRVAREESRVAREESKLQLTELLKALNDSLSRNV